MGLYVMIIYKRWIISDKSGREGGPAAAGFLSIRIIKNKTTVVESLKPVDFHTQEIEPVGFVHQDSNTVQLIYGVLLLLLVKSKQVGKPRTTTPFDPYTEAIMLWDTLFYPDTVQLVNSSGSKRDGCGCDGFCHVVAY